MKSIFTSKQSSHCSFLRRNWITNFSVFLLAPLLFFSMQTFGQAGDLSQIRNGSGKVSQQGLDTCGKCWVNGNAGSSNAHYVEGMSIAYRSLLTGLTPGVCYEYELGYDTYHGAMAIDYLTHFQRLAPHGPFGHPAEVIDPLAMLTGSTPYTMTVIPDGIKDFDIPAPSASGILNGVFNKNGTPRDVSQQALTSFNALPPAQRKMTIYNGEIVAMNYASEAPIVLGGADAETRIRIRFRADDDSVLLAWGGHIASRLDWGYTKNNKGTLIPLSAGGISGSPYHMRQKDMDIVDCTNGNFLGPVTGFGNQDRSLSAAAVIPPPDCPTVGSKTQCHNNQTFNFSVDVPVAGVTYTWSFGTNTANATFQNGTNTGNSVTVIANTGADAPDVLNGGSFTLNITASQNGVEQECPGLATGTVVDVDVSATASSNTDPVAGYNAVIDRAIGNTSTLNAVATGGTGGYTYAWTDADNANGSFSSATAANPVYTVTANGEYLVTVVATNTATGCTASRTLTILVVGGTPNCVVTGPPLICPGTSGNIYKYDPDENTVANAIPTNFTAKWTFSANTAGASIVGSDVGNSVSITVGTACNKSFTIRITLTSTSGLITTYCEKTVTVNDTEPPVITDCPDNLTLECGASTDPEDTGEPTFTDNCGATASHTDATASNCNRTVIKRTWTVTDVCGNTASCVQIIIVTDTEAPEITCDGNSITVTDNCSAGAEIIKYYTDAGGVRTWTAVDAAGNVATKNCNLDALRQVTKTTEVVSSLVSKPTTVTATTETSLKSATVVKLTATDEIQLKAQPNPFSDRVNFRFISPVSGKATLELHNLIGQKIGVVYDGMIKAGTTYDIPYNARGLKASSLIYTLRVNNKSVNGKLIQLK